MVSWIFVLSQKFGNCSFWQKIPNFGAKDTFLHDFFFVVTNSYIFYINNYKGYYFDIHFNPHHRILHLIVNNNNAWKLCLQCHIETYEFNILQIILIKYVYDLYDLYDYVLIPTLLYIVLCTKLPILPSFAFITNTCRDSRIFY